MRDQYTDAPTCYYCGEPASDIEHVIPRAFLRRIRAVGDPQLLADIGLYSSRLKVVPSCKECNSLLGTKYFGTTLERRAFVQGRLRSRYRLDLAVPAWTGRELAELRGTLQRFVVEAQARKERIQRRVSGATFVAAPAEKKRRGRRLGRPRKLSEDQVMEAARWLEDNIGDTDVGLSLSRRGTWYLRYPDESTELGWRTVDEAPVDQLPELLQRHRQRQHSPA